MPRILPLAGVAVVGVLALNALAGARDLPGLVSGARAWAEESAKPPPPASPKPEQAATGEAKDAAGALPPPSLSPRPVCAPTAAELAKQAGLSPAELQVLQSLGERRGQLDERESELNTQLALLAAAEAKLDAKLKALTGLKGELQDLLDQANSHEAAEIDRLVKVFEGMKAKDAAPRLAVLDDSVRLPIASKMKERTLAAIVAEMPTGEAKKLTEALAKRYTEAQAAAVKAQAAATAQSAPPPAAAPAPAAKAPPSKRAAAAPPRKPAPAAKQAEAPAEPAPAAGAE